MRARALTGPAIVAANVAFVTIAVAWSWPEWWVNIDYEQSALTWWSTAQLAVIALVSFGCFRFAKGRGEKLLWLAVGCAFVFLAADERFQIHETIRDRILKPDAIGTSIPGIGPGEVILPLYALGGLVVAWRLFLAFDRGSRIWLVAGILAAGLSVGLDSHEMKNAGRNALRLEQFVEELLETAGQTCFLAAWSRHLWRLREPPP